MTDREQLELEALRVSPWRSFSAEEERLHNFSDEELQAFIEQNRLTPPRADLQKQAWQEGYNQALRDVLALIGKDES